MRIEHTEASLHAVLDFFVQAYTMKPGEKIESFKVFISPDGERVVFKLYIGAAPGGQG